MATAFNDDLPDWGTIKPQRQWSGLLLGNGLSQAVWSKFAYKSLYDHAATGPIANPLSAEDVQLFDALQTKNFELVLEALSTTRRVGAILNMNIAVAEQRYESIRRSLVQAVQSVHIPWTRVPAPALRAIRSELLAFDHVYSTNYDLLVYWAVMVDDGLGFKDYFWSEEFDVSNTDIWDKVTKVLYLHGGLHLYRHVGGGTIKRRAQAGLNLLDLFGTAFAGGAVPLFISEGTDRDKMNSILRSDYLAFAFSKWSQHKGPVVAFGHSFDQADAHLVSAMNQWGHADIAIGMRRGTRTPAEIVENKASLQRRLPMATLHFFDATTHPLGAANLAVVP